jgi:hypothetical protein
MGLVHGPKCTTCNNPLRADIDKLLLSDEPTRKVSRWLKEQHNVDIGHNALAIHKRDHCDVLGDAQERIAEQDAKRRAGRAEQNVKRREAALGRAKAKAVEQAHEDAVQRIVASVELLDDLATLNLNVVKTLAVKMSDPEAKKGMAEVLLYNGACQTVRGCVKDRHEITHGDGGARDDSPPVFKVEISHPLKDPESNDS